MSFSPKRSTETEVFTVDYVNLLAQGETIASAQWAATVLRGNDASPSAMISGAPTITGSQVSQLITGGQPDTFYNLTCKATTSNGQVLVLPEPGQDSLLVTK